MHSGPAQLKDWLRRRGFNQAEGARYLGLDQASMSNFLAGKRTPGLDLALRIERLTGIPVEAWSTPSALDGVDDPTGHERAQAPR